VKQREQLGEWHLVEKLGEGGNGQVWAVRNTRTRKHAAIKILDSRNTNSERYLRFQREVGTLKDLAPSQLAILPLLDFHLSDDISTEPAWFVMEHASLLGVALADAPVASVVAAIRDVAETLEQLVHLGLHHRDVKPGNLFYRDGRPEVGDFGLIKRLEADDETITREGHRPGPYAYMPSEVFQRLDDADDELVDVYCLAMTLWVLVAGEHSPPRSPIEPGGHFSLGRHCPGQKHVGELDEILARATAADPERRPRMGEFARMLDRWLTNLEAGEGFAAQYAAIERNKRQVLRWIVDYAHRTECFFGMNILSASTHEVDLPPGIAWEEMSVALEGLHEAGLIDGEPDQHFSPPADWINVYPTATGAAQVLDEAVIVARLAPLLRSLPREPRWQLRLSRRDTTPDGFDDHKLPPAHYVFLMRIARAHGFADFTEHPFMGYIVLQKPRLTHDGLRFLAELEQPS
jgi:hypothetical protein